MGITHATVAVGTDAGTGEIHKAEWNATHTGADFALLEQHTASNSATLDFTTAVSATYDEYLIELLGLIPATNTANLLMTVSTDGGATWLAGTSYNTSYQFSKIGTGSTGTVVSGSSAAFHIAEANSNNSAGGVSGTVRLYDPLSGARDTPFIFDLTQFNSGDSSFYNYHGSAVYTATTTLNAVRFAFSSGNITSGTIRVYGLGK